MKNITEVYIAAMKCSNGVFFYVTLKNSENDTITPMESQKLSNAFFEALEWADFVGVEMNMLKSNDYVEQEYIDSSYKEARRMFDRFNR